LAKPTTADWSLSANVYSVLLKDSFVQGGAQKLEGCSSVLASDLVWEYIGMHKELIYCGVFLLLPFGPSAGQNASNTGVAPGILSILPLLPSLKNTFEYSDPGGR